MTNAEILSHIDHTILKPDATWEDIAQICKEAVKYRTASVCIPPYYVAETKKAFPNLNICTVVGFPLGYETTAGKLAETKQAIADGANEVDMVINITDVKNGDFEAVTEEIRALKACCGIKVLKVIVETCYLTEEEKVAVCKCVTEGGADYIKTSTGFGTAGATLADVELFKRHIGEDVKIKAAGGIRTIEDLMAFLHAGCDRIGTSAAVSLLKDKL